MPSRRPPGARIVVALLFAISALNQLVQVPREFIGDQPLPALGAWHLAAGLPGLATAFGAWTAARWAWMAALSWGIGTAGLILSLEPLLQLPPEQAEGFGPAVAVVAALALLAAWYLYRAARTPPREGNAEAASPD